MVKPVEKEKRVEIVTRLVAAGKDISFEPESKKENFNFAGGREDIKIMLAG